MIQILNQTDSESIRENFINIFVDTKTSYYEKISRIDPKIIVNQRTCYFLHDTLLISKRKLIKYEEALQFLSQQDGNVYVMLELQNIMTGQYEDEESRLLKNNGYSGNTVLITDSRELSKIILYDNTSEGLKRYSERQLPEDIYVFDKTYEWYIAFTHGFLMNNIGENCRICFSNIVL